MTLTEGREIFVITGEFADARRDYPQHSWLRLPPSSEQQLSSKDGALLYVREGGLPVERANDRWVFDMG